MSIELILGDCLVEMGRIADGSVDAIICDLPYGGMTACAWDVLIPFEPLWEHYRRVIKPNGAVVLFGSQPFTSALVMSNPGMFRYDIVWDKVTPTGYLNAKRMPLRSHESILIFGRGPLTYNPQMIERGADGRRIGDAKNHRFRGKDGRPGVYGTVKRDRDYEHARSGWMYPKSIHRFGTGSGWDKRRNIHPTQKPVPLLEFLVRTYSNSGETVLDNCFGSGTCAVACLNTGRNFIGIEKSPEYFKIAQQRIADAQAQPALLPSP